MTEPDRETYRSCCYSPDRAAKRYARREGGGYKVFECAALPAGHWLAAIGAGPTLREYVTAGAEIPEAIRARAGDVVEWPLQFELTTPST